MNSTQIFVFILFFLIDLLLTAIRASLLNARLERLVSRKEAGEENLEKTIELVTRRARTRSALKLSQSLVRFTLAGLMLTYLVLPSFTNDNHWAVMAFLLLAGLVIWLFEFILERLALRSPESWSVSLTGAARVLVAVMGPLTYLPLRLSGGSQAQNLVTITEDELIHLVDASQMAGEIEKDESEMIHSVFEFGDTLAREIMVPRVDMLALEVNTPLEEAADTLLKSGFSRVPVYEEQIDNIIGLLYTKDMLQVWRSGSEITSLRPLLRPARFIPETKFVDELLDEMQAMRIHISIVVDEYGGVAGLVTLEDIVEEIFGEIQDEYDGSEEDLWQNLGEGKYLLDGRVPLDEVNTVFGIDLPVEDADTIGGLVFARLGRVPSEGDTLEEAGAVFTVAEISERRVHKVEASLLPLAKVDEVEKENRNGKN